ncbi:hypothetical protein BJ912DRAFT_611355 [Pholiota molesta]|nr:hypothetical protein BJ912DRAFT_611355 [Pholiota molesta]
MENDNSTQSSTQDNSRGQASSVSVHEQGPSTSTTIYSPDNSNTIYERHLEKKKKGFPLWIPEPNRSLPMQYRRKGVNIGDVGIITPSGGFFFLFNICSPHDDPINPRRLPEGFSPVHPPIDAMDIREYSEFKPESYLTSTAIERTDNDPPFRGLSFATSATEGAVLTLPDGAISRDLVNIRRFRAYAAANIESWYRYVNGPRGCEAQNGEVRLVTGCVKATSWGMAAVANMTQHKTHHLKYRSVEDVTAPTAPIPLYKWEHTGFAEARVGPDLHEIEDLKRDDDSDVAVGGKYWNQCLFVRTLNITLNDGAFATISQELESALILESQQYHDKGTSSKSTSNPPTPGAETGINTGQQLATDLATQTRPTSKSPGSEVETLSIGNVMSKRRVIMSTSPSAPVSHPADVLNKCSCRRFPIAELSLPKTWIGIL